MPPQQTRRFLGLAAAYARLPALAQQAGEAAAQTDPSVEDASAGRLRWWPPRLSVLAGRQERR
jgi:hypothetical protein